MVELTKIRKTQLSAQAVNEMIDWLSSGRINVGDKLPPEHEIMGKLGVGRSTIREAVKVLEHLGFLNVRVGNGTYLAAKPSHVEPFLSRLRRADIKEVQHFKVGLEAQIAYLAAQNRTAGDIRSIQSKLKKCVKAYEDDDLVEFANADFEFHKTIAKAANTSLLYDFYITVREIVNIIEQVSDKSEVLNEKILNTHAKLFDAIKSGDTRKARNIWLEMEMSNGNTTGKT
ncbi:MAG: FCD domain-containing protein [Gammaproteobacteria bacterium]|nr:FCD domain-containing protein [Gammaproteobacteria bacterium]